MDRRRFISAISASAAVLKAQIKGRVVNDDDHPMSSNAHMKLAGEDGATLKYASPTGGTPAASRVATIAHHGVSVTTRAYDNTRSGHNPHESLLTFDAIQTRGLRIEGELAITDDPRLESAPLIVCGVKLDDGSVHDLCIQSSMGNGVYAFDCATKEPLWKARLGTPIADTSDLDAWSINVQNGIFSTGCVDTETNILYLVAWTSPNGTMASASHSIHAIYLANGTHVKTPLSLESVSFDPGNGAPVQYFKSSQRKQRAALTLAMFGDRKTILIPFGTILEQSNQNRGWLIAYDIISNSIGASFTTAVKYAGGGIWMAGGGCCVDASSHIFLVTGNGSFNPATGDWGECHMALSYTPPGVLSAGSFRVLDWWSPYSDSGRAGGKQDQDHVTFSRGQGWDDADLGSAGCALIPQYNLLASCGKDGILYLLDSRNMGKTQLSDFAHPAVNYSRVKWAGFATYYPGNGISPTPNQFSDLDFLSGQKTRHNHATPVIFNSAEHGVQMFIWGENGPLRCWSVTPDGQAHYLCEGNELASFESPIPGGMSGGMSCVTSNNGRNPLLFAIVPSGDANRSITEGSLMIYDISQVHAGQVRLVWNSSQFNIRFKDPKFNVPVVANGRIFLPTYDGRIIVLGLNS